MDDEKATNCNARHFENDATPRAALVYDAVKDVDPRRLHCGDVVRRKSDAMSMWVRSSDGGRVRCDWLEGTTEHQDEFDEADLEIAHVRVIGFVDHTHITGGYKGEQLFVVGDAPQAPSEGEERWRVYGRSILGAMRDAGFTVQDTARCLAWISDAARRAEYAHFLAISDLKDKCKERIDAEHCADPFADYFSVAEARLSETTGA